MFFVGKYTGISERTMATAAKPNANAMQQPAASGIQAAVAVGLKIPSIE